MCQAILRAFRTHQWTKYSGKLYHALGSLKEALEATLLIIPHCVTLLPTVLSNSSNKLASVFLHIPLYLHTVAPVKVLKQVWPKSVLSSAPVPEDIMDSLKHILHWPSHPSEALVQRSLADWTSSSCLKGPGSFSYTWSCYGHFLTGMCLPHSLGGYRKAIFSWKPSLSPRD